MIEDDSDESVVHTEAEGIVTDQEDANTASDEEDDSDGGSILNPLPPPLGQSSLRNPMSNLGGQGVGPGPQGSSGGQGSSTGGQGGASGSSSSGGNVAPSATATTITIGGEVIAYDPAVTAQPIAEAFYKKTDRASLMPDKKALLFSQATQTRLTVKFDLISATFSEEDKLDDTYNLGVLVNRFKSHCQKYDMLDVMTIIELDPKNAAIPTGATMDLLSDYSKIREVDVAKSCEWYRTYTTPDYYRENLQLTGEFLENNCTEALWEKCSEAHEEYPAKQRGGPLLFLIMMKLLQSHSDHAVQYLINSVKNLKISNFEGENVSKVVSLVRGAYKRLKSITKLPEEFPQWVLQLMQTSSVTPFNDSFSHLQRNIEVVETLSSGQVTPLYPTVESMLQVAQKLYLDMISTSKWSGLNTKANQSAFMTNVPKAQGTNKITCWNCGQEGHSLKECTKPINQNAVEQRKNAFREKKKSERKNGNGKKDGRGSNKKWSPPTPDERNRRVIDGRPMFFVKKTGRWEPDKKAAGTSPGANTAVPAPTPLPLAPTHAPSPASTDDGSKAARDLAHSNMSHSMNVMMNNYLNAIKEM